VVAQSSDENSECTIHKFSQENQVKQQNISKKMQLDVLWLQVGCVILYLDHGCTDFPKIYKIKRSSIARNVT
jgi:hypothetical protein